MLDAMMNLNSVAKKQTIRELGDVSRDKKGIIKAVLIANRGI